MKKAAFFFLMLVCFSVSAMAQEKAMTSKLLTEPLREFIKKYDKERQVKTHPIVYVEVDKDQRSFKVRFMDKCTFFSMVQIEDSTLFMDGGIIEGRKIVLCYEAGRNFMINTPLSCAQIVRVWDKDLYEAFLEMDALRGTDEYDRKHGGRIMLSHAPMMFIECDEKGNIKDIKHLDKTNYPGPLFDALRKLGVSTDSIEIY